MHNQLPTRFQVKFWLTPTFRATAETCILTTRNNGARTNMVGFMTDRQTFWFPNLFLNLKLNQPAFQARELTCTRWPFTKSVTLWDWSTRPKSEQLWPRSTRNTREMHFIFIRVSRLPPFTHHSPFDLSSKLRICPWRLGEQTFTPNKIKCPLQTMWPRWTVCMERTVCSV